MKIQHREQHLRKNTQDKQLADQIITRTNEIGDKYTRRTITASLQSTRTLKRLQRSQPSNKVTRTGKNTSTDTHPRHNPTFLLPQHHHTHPLINITPYRPQTLHTLKHHTHKLQFTMIPTITTLIQPKPPTSTYQPMPPKQTHLIQYMTPATH